MKKTVFIAALAIVAMASCTKNELKVPSNGTDAVISFQPVVANATKATYLETANMKTKCTEFGVFAWYPDGGTMQTTTTTGTKYMDNVTVTYNGSFNDTDDTGTGTWAPSTTYYWPKNGKLSFDAYAPADAHAASTPGAGKGTFNSDIKKGLQIADYTVAELANQYDLLYSTRATNKNTSVGETNATYDGVDIPFNHALAAIEVKAKTAADYGTDAIKLNKITIQNAFNKGTFDQGMTNAMTIGTPKWSNQDNEVEYVLYDAGSTLSDGASLSQTPLESPTISNAILLPQDFDHTTTGKIVSIKVDYSIKGTNDYLAQTQTFKLNTTTGSEAGGSYNPLSAWEIGKKYTYTLVFTLEDIHFAPSVADWTEVTVKDIDVK